MNAPPVVDAIIGARPNIMKVAALARAIAADGALGLRLVHTGQHYDADMSGNFLRELGLPHPAHNLSVGSGSQGSQTARVIEGYEALLVGEQRPRGVLVVGDVTSTMACALAAVKLQVPVAHVEAGLRSGDRSMPEEINRIVTDAVSDLLFVSDPDGIANLAREGHPTERVKFVGNVMIDTLLAELERASAARLHDALGIGPGQYVYMTLHRPSNVDEPAVLGRIVETLGRLCEDIPFVFAMHPRTRARVEQFGIALPKPPRFHTLGPLGYHENIAMIRGARAVLSDSGGIQEEASALQVPCLTLRSTTERPCTVELGSSELVGADPVRIEQAWERLLSGRWKRAQSIPLWDGHAAERVVAHLKEAWA